MMTTKDLAVLLIRLVLGFVFFSAGVSKIPGAMFGNLIGPTMLLDTLSEHGLRHFGALIAASQIVVGALVLSQRFSLVGLIALMPMHIGILGVTLSQGWGGTPYINAFLLALNLVALAYEHKTIRALIEPQLTKVEPSAALRLFPQDRLAVSGVLAALFGAGAAFAEHALLGAVAGFSCLGILLANLYQKPARVQMDKLDIAAVTLSALSMTSVALIYYIRTSMQIPKFHLIAFGCCGVSTVLCALLLMFKGWRGVARERLERAGLSA